MNSELVSILIPAFNRASLIGETLDSVIEQTYKDWECLVVDDGSTDETEAIVNQYQKKDPRIRFFNRPDHFPKGANSCRNFGFEQSNGEYIQWLDSDDLLGHDKLELQVDAIKSDVNASMAIGKFGYFADKANLNVRGQVKTYQDFDVGLELLEAFGRYTEYFPPHVFLTKRKVIEAAGLWNDTLDINQDGEFFTRVLLQAKKVKFVDTVVYYRRTRNDNVSLINSSNKAQKLIDCWKLIQEHIFMATGRKKHIYVERAKKVILNSIKDEYPEIVMNNVAFFQSIKPFYKRFFN